jgi:hypothetical protein
MGLAVDSGMSLNPVLVNGPFGSGKTAVCAELLRARPTHASFDTEWLGWLLRTTFQQRKPVDGFQDWLSWHRLVVATAVGEQRAWH